MRRHLDVGQLLGHLGEADSFVVLRPSHAGEHQLLVGVLVVDHEQAVLGAALDREVAEEVVVVPELLLLLLGGLRHRVEGRGAGQDRVAPADQDVGSVAQGDVVVSVDARPHLGEPE